jgi:hypothetical protein
MEMNIRFECCDRTSKHTFILLLATVEKPTGWRFLESERRWKYGEYVTIVYPLILSNIESLNSISLQNDVQRLRLVKMGARNAESDGRK